MRWIIAVLTSVLVAAHAVNIGERLPHVVLEKENGGTSDGKSWDSSTLESGVHLLLYMDPDRRKETQPLFDRLKRSATEGKPFPTVAIVNLAATWMPDFVLESMLSKKQKELKNTVFVFDRRKYLVDKWRLEDEASNVMIVDRNSEVLYYRSGEISPAEAEHIINLIQSMVD
ncbi:protein ytfJ precursor [Hydrogenimonas sp.]|nr:protein ytfJ precursor [Hydrogenimonas sp.]